MERTSTLPKLAALVAAGALVLAACGDDDADDATGTTGAAAVTTAGSAATAAPGTTAPVGTTAAPGDIYAVPETTSGTPAATDAPADGGAALITTATTDLGEVLVGEGGLTVYGFTPDEGGTPTCVAECAGNWPPVLVDSAELPAGLDPAVFSVVEYPEGGFSVRAGDWPLYYFGGDVVPGDTNGQGVNGVWFVVDPAGNLVNG